MAEKFLKEELQSLDRKILEIVAFGVKTCGSNFCLIRSCHIHGAEIQSFVA